MIKMGKRNLRLTEREYAIMNVLWENQKDMTIHEISVSSHDPALTTPCVAQIIPRLVKRGFVHVEQVMPVKTKYARTFLPDISKEQYLTHELNELYQKTDITGILNMLIKIDCKREDSKLLDKLENYIKEHDTRREEKN